MAKRCKNEDVTTGDETKVTNKLVNNLCIQLPGVGILIHCTIPHKGALHEI